MIKGPFPPGFWETCDKVVLIAMLLLIVSGLIWIFLTL